MYGAPFVTFQAFIKKNKNVLGVVIPLANSYGYGTYLRTVQYTVPYRYGILPYMAVSLENSF